MSREAETREPPMSSPEPWFVVGLDNGGNQNNATVLDAAAVAALESLAVPQLT